MAKGKVQFSLRHLLVLVLVMGIGSWYSMRFFRPKPAYQSTVEFRSVEDVLGKKMLRAIWRHEETEQTEFVDDQSPLGNLDLATWETNGKRVVFRGSELNGHPQLQQAYRHLFERMQKEENLLQQTPQRLGSKEPWVTCKLMVSRNENLAFMASRDKIEKTLTARSD